ncbi:MAG: lytic transglycosylase domain-containing protein [Pseudomonadota bacterium]|nr:lytic transglycosylase domain-containing protein [Pseudomonadota bacterium]
MIRPGALLLVLLGLAAVASPRAEAANLDQQNYLKAFRALDAGHPDQAVVYSFHGRDPVLNKVLRSAYMAQPGNDITFEEMAEFVAANPDWPNLKSILAIAEQKIPARYGAAEVTSWFAAHPPVTLVGFYRFIEALQASGQSQHATRLIRTRWIEGDFSPDELTAFYARFAALLGPETIYARLDRLVWKNDINGARRLYPYVEGDARALAEARLSLANQTRNSELLVASLPASDRDNPGLLYERLRWLQRNNRDSEANEILLHAPAELGKAEAWWDQRQIMVRRAMEKRDFALAAQLATDHGQTDPKPLVQAEFLAGWLDLRFLNQPEEAREHFRVVCDNSTTPISRARGFYWMGRSYEALGSRSEAEQAYEEAATLNVTFYGQLAETRLYEHPIIKAAPEPAVPTATRSVFYARDVIRAIERLHALNENDRAHTFFRAAAEAATRRADFALLMELAYQIRRPDLAIEAAKAANQKNIVIAAGGFPLLDRSFPRPPEPAFTHALIRQESMFNPKAQSPVGAAGLMQLMPRTAKGVAQQQGLRFSASKLTDPDYNLRLGTAFVQKQIEMFNGSYILALAAYNAGPGRVHEWLNAIGDPRDKHVDPVDWIEQIPIPETRNYVQRIMESLQVYRARLTGGQAPLTLAADLRR